MQLRLPPPLQFATFAFLALALPATHSQTAPASAPPTLPVSTSPLPAVPSSSAPLVSASPPLSTPASAPSPAIGVPAKNWVLPLFTAKEGYRNLTLRGSEVRPVGSAQIDVTDLSITVFTGDATARVETMLLSPAASFFPKEQRATGEKSVRLLRDDIELTGEGWVYEHSTKKVSLARHVRVVFSAQLNDILK